MITECPASVVRCQFLAFELARGLIFNWMFQTLDHDVCIDIIKDEFVIEA